MSNAVHTAFVRYAAYCDPASRSLMTESLARGYSGLILDFPCPFNARATMLKHYQCQPAVVVPAQACAKNRNAKVRCPSRDRATWYSLNVKERLTARLTETHAGMTHSGGYFLSLWLRSCVSSGLMVHSDPVCHVQAVGRLLHPFQSASSLSGMANAAEV